MKNKAAKKFNNVKEFCIEWKKQTIIVAVMCVALFIVLGITLMIKQEMANDINTTYATITAVKNEYLQYKTKMEQTVQWKEEPTGEIVWTGDVVDIAKVKTDSELFWDYISPAFNYNSGTEYMEHRQIYVNDLGNCLFTVQFLTPIFKETTPNFDTFSCRATKKDPDYRIYPTKMEVEKDANGNIVKETYDYIAFVTMYPSKLAEGSREVAFTFTIDNEYNLTNFECFPPSRSN